MSTFTALFVTTTVVLFILTVTAGVCLGVAWLWEKAFGSRPEDEA